MKIEIKELMDNNEMLSHIFLGCIPTEKIKVIQRKYLDGKDWEKESVKIPVEMKIGGISVNPKKFFDSWKDQIQRMISDKAKELVSSKLGSSRMREMQDKLYNFEQVLESWESEINWDVENTFVENNKEG